MVSKPTIFVIIYLLYEKEFAKGVDLVQGYTVYMYSRDGTSIIYKKCA